MLIINNKHCIHIRVKGFLYIETVILCAKLEIVAIMQH